MRVGPGFLHCCVIVTLGAACSGKADPDPMTGPDVDTLPEASGLTHPSGDVNATLTLGGRPHGIAAAPTGRFYISLTDGNRVTRGQVDSATQSFDSDVTVGMTPAHVAITPDGAFTFTANQFGNSVTVVNAATNAVTGTVPQSDGGFNILTSPNGDRVYATTAAGVLHVIDVASRTVVTTVGRRARQWTGH